MRYNVLSKGRGGGRFVYALSMRGFFVFVLFVYVYLFVIFGMIVLSSFLGENCVCFRFRD